MRDKRVRQEVLVMRRWARAQAAIELALLAPVLALLLVICADSMRVYRTALEVGAAAQAGAAFAAQSPLSAADAPGIRQAATSGGAHLDDLDLTSSVLCGCSGSGALSSCADAPLCSDLRGYVRIEATATFHALIHYPGLGSSLRLKSVATRRVE